MNEPTHLDLFSGIGGFALAAQWAGFRTIGFCEIDGYCQKILSKNFMADAFSQPNEGIQSNGSEETGMGLERDSLPTTRRKQSPDRPCRIHSNIFDLDGTQFAGIDLVTGGFPCQPYSVAGKRRGAADDRALWPEMFRVIGEARPAWVLGENVPGIIPMELDNVLSDLEGIGYATRAFVIPACAVDAKHRRDRVWIIGADGRRSDDCCRWLPEPDVCGMADELSDWLDRPFCTFPPEPSIPRVVRGIKNRVERLKGLGNSVVVRLAYEILREIRKLI